MFRPERQISGCISDVFSGIWDCPWCAVYWLHSGFDLERFEAPLLEHNIRQVELVATALRQDFTLSILVTGEYH